MKILNASHRTFDDLRIKMMDGTIVEHRQGEIELINLIDINIRLYEIVNTENLKDFELITKSAKDLIDICLLGNFEGLIFPEKIPALIYYMGRLWPISVLIEPLFYTNSVSDFYDQTQVKV